MLTAYVRQLFEHVWFVGIQRSDLQDLCLPIVGIRFKVNQEYIMMD